MYPFYTYPHQSNEMHYPQPHFPRLESIPPQMKTPPTPYEHPLPYGCGGNYGYPMPMGCHGYCGHSHFPGYSDFRPSIMPSPFPCHGTYHPFYYAPPHHYSFEQPRYEYDCGDHGCRCPHHPRYRMEDGGVRIEEEHENPSGNSSVPKGVGDFPHPILWVPSGYMRNKDEEKPREENPDKKTHEQEPGVWNGWFPVDLTNVGSMKSNDNGKGNENQKREYKNRSPLPIFWMPYKPDELESKSSADRKELPSGIQIAPVPSPEGGDRIIQLKEKPPSEADTGNTKKSASPKIIPVKQMDPQVVKKDLETFDEKVVKHEGFKKQPSSPTKASKLPPVCLRVDPLPRRRSGGSSSRSPSPPGLKKSKEMDRDRQCLGSKVEETKQVEPKANDEKPVEVLEGGENVVGKIGEMVDKSPSSEEAVKVKRKDLSEAEAAVMIQSRYRGFEVRKWEPLKKLKQIADVQAELLGVKSRIQAIQSSGNEIDNNRERMMIGETIMSLLLKLDSIQGLHTGIRDLRKSVAKELVGLQETLDFMGVAKTLAAAKSSDNLSSIAENDHAVKVEVKEKRSYGSHDCKSDNIEHCQGHSIGSQPSETEEGFENNTNGTLSKGDSEMETVVKPEVEEKIEEVHEETEIAADLEVPGESSLVDNSIFLETNLLSEFPIGLLDEEAVANELQSDGQIEQGTNAVSQMETDVSCDEVRVDSKDDLVDETVEVSEMEDNKVESKEGFEHGPMIPIAADMAEKVDLVDESVEDSEMKDNKVESKEGFDHKPIVPIVELAVEKKLGEADQVLHELKSNDVKLVEENERLRKMMEKLIETGKGQLSTISDLTGRVKDLEKRLAQNNNKKKKKNVKRRRIRRAAAAAGSVVGKAF